MNKRGIAEKDWKELYNLLIKSVTKDITHDKDMTIRKMMKHKRSIVVNGATLSALGGDIELSGQGEDSPRTLAKDTI